MTSQVGRQRRLRALERQQIGVGVRQQRDVLT